MKEENNTHKLYHIGRVACSKLYNAVYSAVVGVDSNTDQPIFKPLYVVRKKFAVKFVAVVETVDNALTSSGRMSGDIDGITPVAKIKQSHGFALAPPKTVLEVGKGADLF